MKIRFAASVIAASLLTAGAALAQSTTTGAANGAAEVPDAVMLSLQGQQVPSVTVPEQVVVGKPLPPTVQLWPVPRYGQYDYAVVNDRRVIVDPGTRRVIKIID
jgi:Protein of unknown function (DUF1236)